jgi:alkylresorcinol/alkylpyrone synthase
MTRSSAALLSVATAAPEFVIDQDLAAEGAIELFGGKVFREHHIRSLFANTGIRTRRAVRPMDWYAVARPWEERNAVYLAEAEQLWLDVARAALRRADVDPQEIGAVVTVSSTGIATPSLEARAGPALGLSPDALRTPVFGLGCAGGVTGLSIAGRLAEARPGSAVLLVVVELCTLSMRPDEPSKTNVVATALFGDGAAAAVLKAGSAVGPKVCATGEYTWPETLEIMGWRVDPAGFGVVLDPRLPDFVRRRFTDASASFMRAAGLVMADIDRFVCHPGGAKVLPAIEASLEIEPGALDIERAVLSAFGNMSAPTVLFVLERVLAEKAEAKRLVLAALGPGFTATFVSLEA